MIIRAEQMEALDAAASSAFEREMVEHLNAFEPRLCQAAKEDGVRRAVEVGIERARALGFTTRGQIAFHLELMCILGWQYEVDPQLAWVSETLENAAPDDPKARANQLYDRANAYLDEIAGPENAHAIAAMKRFHKLDFSAAKPEDDDVTRGLAAIYPEKARRIGDDGLRGLLEAGATEAASCALPPERGRALIAGLMFGLGIGVCSDPLYPWVAETLNDPAIEDGEEKVSRLLRRLSAYVKRALEYLDGEKQA